jgi:hypothetical protein
MSLYNSYDRTKQFAELLVPYDIGSGEVSSATQQATALSNLGLTTSIGYVSGATPGTATANQAVVLDASKNEGGLGTLTGIGFLAGAATAVIGFATGLGSGGAVTQATSKSTGVTLNTPTGEITMNNAALAAAAIVSFTLTDSSIGAHDTIAINHASAGTVGSYLLNAQAAAGSATVTVTNISAGSLSEAIVLRYAVIKGSIT